MRALRRWEREETGLWDDRERELLVDTGTYQLYGMVRASSPEVGEALRHPVLTEI